MLKTFWPLIQASGLGIVRNVAAAGGAYLYAHSYVTHDQETSFVGSVFFLGSLAFTIYDKLMVHKALNPS